MGFVSFLFCVIDEFTYTTFYKTFFGSSLISIFLIVCYQYSLR